MIKIIVDKCINLYLRKILENSNGKRKCSTLTLPIVRGNNIYCSKNVLNEISDDKIIKLKISNDKMVPNNP